MSRKTGSRQLFWMVDLLLQAFAACIIHRRCTKIHHRWTKQGRQQRLKREPPITQQTTPHCTFLDLYAFSGTAGVCSNCRSSTPHQTWRQRHTSPVEARLVARQHPMHRPLLWRAQTLLLPMPRTRSLRPAKEAPPFPSTSTRAQGMVAALVRQA